MDRQYAQARSEGARSDARDVQRVAPEERPPAHTPQEAWINIHKNARLTPYRRQELVARVERGEPVTAVARAFGVSRQTARKWMLRKRDAGMVDSTAWAGDGSSRPAHSPRQTEAKIQLAIKVLRWQRWTCRQIAGALAIDTSTAARILRRVGLSRRPRPEPPATVQRYEHAAVGDLLHLDMKKLGRITSVGRSVRGFVRRARAWFRARGARIRRVLTDNDSAYLSRGFARPVEPSIWRIVARGRTRRAPTARPNASSRPCCANGPISAPTTRRPIERAYCPAGWSTTIALDRMPLWGSSPP